MTRSEARTASSKFYGPTTMCKHGHLCERYTANALCVECAKTRAAFDRAFRPELKIESAKRCRSHTREYIRRYYAVKPHAWRARESRLSGQRCGCCDSAALNEFYALAIMLGMEVDHKTPLAMGGLHCAKNLQVLTLEDHATKTCVGLRNIRAARTPLQ